MASEDRKITMELLVRQEDWQLGDRDLDIFGSLLREYVDDYPSFESMAYSGTSREYCSLAVADFEEIFVPFGKPLPRVHELYLSAITDFAYSARCSYTFPRTDSKYPSAEVFRTLEKVKKYLFDLRSHQIPVEAGDIGEVSRSIPGDSG